MIPDVRLDLGRGAFARPVRETEVTSSYVDGLNDPEVHRFLVGPRQQRQTLQSVQAFVAGNACDPAAVLFGLHVGGALRGTSRLHDIVPGQSAHIGIALFDKRVWGEGWGRRLIEAVAAWALNEYCLAAVEAGIELGNVASERAFAGAGFSMWGKPYAAHGQQAQLWRRVAARQAIEQVTI